MAESTETEKILLTELEVEILRRLSGGALVKQLMDLPGYECRSNTVSRRLRVIREKLGVVSNREAVLKAQQLGLLEAPALAQQ